MTPYYSDDSVTLFAGDCLDVLAGLPDASVDAVVTDPPYGLEFMGREWDSFKGTAWRTGAGMTSTGYTDGGKRLARPAFGGSDSANATCATCGGRMRGAKKCMCDEPEWRVKGEPLGSRNNNVAQMRAFGDWCEQWAAECLRVLKPGGHLLAFGGTRTWHRLTCAVEDAGFEIRDSIAWLYGSGFPKSLDVSKAIDRAVGADREVVGVSWEGKTGRTALGQGSGWNPTASPETHHMTAPATDAARQWQGWGTALKPAHEPIVVARKPLAGTVAATVLEHGTGALNIDATRVEGEPWKAHRATGLGSVKFFTEGETPEIDKEPHTAGRWPTNVVLDGDTADELDRQTGVSRDGVAVNRNKHPKAEKPHEVYGGGWLNGDLPDRGYGGEGGASRFFPTFRYEPKAGTAERPRHEDTAHPTVKPLDLMRWLVRLVTPPGGTVLEPFAGSGTTAEACVIEGFKCIAIERDETYLPLIKARLSKPIQVALAFDEESA